MELSDQQIAQYFYRSYTSVDGLWFMKVEEKLGFAKSLEIDSEVWKVLPKIQARFLKSFGKNQDGMDALYECLTTKYVLEGFQFISEKYDHGFHLKISRCPWFELMVKSGREKIAGEVGTKICKTEYPVWAAEFGPGISFELKEQICKGAEFCFLGFQNN